MLEEFECPCGTVFKIEEKDAYIKHMRQKHPKEGALCWVQCGSVGDSFADDALNWQQCEMYHEIKRAGEIVYQLVDSGKAADRRQREMIEEKKISKEDVADFYNSGGLI